MPSFYPDWIHDPVKTQVDAANTKSWDFQVEIQLVKKDESFTGEAAKHTCLSWNGNCNKERIRVALEILAVKVIFH